MTPAERARHIDRQEYEAECRAARERALHRAEARRQQAAARVAEWIGKEPPPSLNTRPRPSRKPKLYTYNGASKSLSEWASCCGVDYQTLARRIRSGMAIEQALTMKPRARAQQHTVNGVSKTLAEWAKHVDIKYDTLIARMFNGRTLAEALAMPSGRWRGVSCDLEGSKGTGAPHKSGPK
ncbi:hypothetical protein [Nitratireductor luteus]|uniref:hypothetical protein n=1 Tax=Nitratireductor luteus TaxID=2976980 RepID=UPI002240BE4A|nr:hypothetical protein [Nitratireductor luteus]